MMRWYIWNQIELFTDEYSSGDSLVIYTGRDPLEVWTEYSQQIQDVRKSLPEADMIFEGGFSGEEKIFVRKKTGSRSKSLLTSTPGVTVWSSIQVGTDK